MTIKEFATNRGLSTQAVYKKLKGRKIEVDTITEKGQLTEAGEAILRELYSTQPGDQPTNNLKGYQLRVETLTNETTRLQLNVEKLEAQVEALKEERDFLRKMIEQAQEMEGIRARIEALEVSQKAAQAQALTDGSSGTAEQRRSLWARITGRGRK